MTPPFDTLTLTPPQMGFVFYLVRLAPALIGNNLTSKQRLLCSDAPPSYPDLLPCPPTLQQWIHREVALHHALREDLPHEQENHREQEATPRAREGSRLAITASQVAQQEDNFADALFNSISTRGEAGGST